MMESKFKVGDKVFVCMNSVPIFIETVVSVSGTKRISVRITGDAPVFNENGRMGDGDFYSWDIRHPKDGEVERFEFEKLSKRMSQTIWRTMSKAKLQRIAAIIDEVES